MSGNAEKSVLLEEKALDCMVGKEAKCRGPRSPVSLRSMLRCVAFFLSEVGFP